jgi:hypothetical protein
MLRIYITQSPSGTGLLYIYFQFDCFFLLFYYHIYYYHCYNYMRIIVATRILLSNLVSVTLQ